MGTRTNTNGRKRRSVSQNKSANGSARDDLLAAAIKHFARNGLSGTSIRDIANEAKINSSMISYYFDGKEGLYRACLQMIAETRLKFANEVLTEPSSTEEFKVRLGLFIDNLFKTFLEDRDIGLIVIREYDRINSPAEKVFKTHFLEMVDLIVRFFESAQQRDLMRKDLDGFIMAWLFFGAVTSQLRLDHIKQKAYSRSLKNESERHEVRDQIVALFTESKN